MLHTRQLRGKWAEWLDNGYYGTFVSYRLVGIDDKPVRQPRAVPG